MNGDSTIQPAAPGVSTRLRYPILISLLVAGLAPILACSPAGDPSEVRPALEAVPSPVLQGLPEPGRILLEQERAELDAVLASETAGESRLSNLELARAYGELAELYHAYGLTSAAAIAYDNAIALGCGREPDTAAGGGAECKAMVPWVYLRGVLDQVEGDRDGAMAAFHRVLAVDPGDRPARLRLVDLHLAAGELDPAEALLHPLGSRGAGEGETEGAAAATIFARGRIASARDDPATAVELYEQALALQPDAETLHSVLATAYRRLGDREKAEFHGAAIGSGTVSFADPDLERVQGRVVGLGPILERALVHTGNEEHAAAAESYLEALQLEPDNPTALRGAANALRRDGQVSRAVELLRRFVETHPENRLARLELGTTLIEAGLLDEATARLESLTTDEPEFQQALANLGVAHARGNRWAEAEQAFARALELDPFDQITRFQQALVQKNLAQQGKGSPEAALRTLERIVDEAPTFVRARQHLGDLLHERGQPEAAATHFQAVTEIAEAAPQERALAAYQLGVIATEASRLDEAIAHFESSIALFPELWQAHLALAHRYRDAGRHVAAAERYAAASALQPALMQARTEEAASWARAGRPRQALERLGEGLRTHPRAAELANLRAGLLATVADESLRNGQEALSIASGLFQALPRPEHEETLALALAAVGRFDEALARQERLLAQARQQGNVLDARRLEQNLLRFRQRQAGRLF